MKTIVRRLTKRCPRTKSGIEKVLGLPLTRIGSGVFRVTYHIGSTRLVIKIPKNVNGVEHARREMEAITKLIKKVPALMPKVVFFHQRNGVVVQKKYKTEGIQEHHAEKVQARLERLKLPHDDVHDGNIAFEGRRLKVIDLGCFYE